MSEAVDSVREGLKEAIAQQDSQLFNQRYLAFLRQFPAFQQVQAQRVTSEPLTSAILGGAPVVYLTPTDDARADRLLQQAKRASNVMATLKMADRLRFLALLKARIKEHSSEIETAITADTGKPIDLSHKEMAKGGDWFSWAVKHADETLADSTHTGGVIERQRPMGAVQVIGAYNYPYALAIGGIVGALVAGNGVIVSAPKKAPGWVFPFMAAAQAAVDDFVQEKGLRPEAATALSDGLVQYSIGVNNRLTAGSDVVHFVGSNGTGEAISKLREHKTTILEMGGSNVVTVMASAIMDAGSAKKIAASIYSGFGPATGQRCTAPRILCVQHGAEDVVKALQERCDAGPTQKQIGNPFEAGVEMGPLVDKGAYDKMKATIALAEGMGAKVSGTLKANHNYVPFADQSDTPQNYWVNPIIIDWSRVSSERMKEVNATIGDEIFGPLLHIVHPVKDLDGAIAITNTLDSHKLAGAIYTEDKADLERYAKETHVVSMVENGPPKDTSPTSVHGHPNMLQIGGLGHFRLYSQGTSIARN